MYETEDPITVIKELLPPLLDGVKMQYKLNKSLVLNELLLNIGCTYIVDPTTKEIIWVNETLRKEFGDVIGKICYKTLQNNSKVCEFCPYPKLTDQPEKLFKWVHKNLINGKIYLIHDVYLPNGFNGYHQPLQLEMAIELTQEDIERINLLNF